MITNSLIEIWERNAPEKSNFSRFFDRKSRFAEKNSEIRSGNSIAYTQSLINWFGDPRRIDTPR
jgi:hypothetical protein